MLADLKASKGIIITNIGYTRAAIERARFDSRDIQLDILEFEDLPQFSGIEDVFPSRWNEKEKLAVVFSSPHGWVVHKTPMKGYSAGLTKKNLTWQQGLDSKELIYMSLISKSEFPKLEDLYKYQDEKSKSNYPGVEFDYHYDLDERFENYFCEKMILRVGYYLQYPEIDYTLFLDFGTFITYSPYAIFEKKLK
jgi:hypothetical protein